MLVMLRSFVWSIDWICHQSWHTSTTNLRQKCGWCLERYLSLRTYYIDDRMSVTAVISCLRLCRRYQSSARYLSYRPRWKIWPNCASVQETNLERSFHFVPNQSKQLLLTFSTSAIVVCEVECWGTCFANFAKYFYHFQHVVFNIGRGYTCTIKHSKKVLFCV